jgi:RecJ-like exonuclease
MVTPTPRTVKRNWSVDLMLLSHIREHHGVSMDEVLDYLTRSTKATHLKGNRRFHDWFFTLNENDKVVSYCKGEEGEVIRADDLRAQKLAAKGITPAMPPERGKTPPEGPSAKPQGGRIDRAPSTPEPFYKCEVCHDTGKVAVTDECAWCEGAGCEKCHQTGGTTSQIPCPSCGVGSTHESFVKGLFSKVKKLTTK